MRLVFITLKQMAMLHRSVLPARSPPAFRTTGAGPMAVMGEPRRVCSATNASLICLKLMNSVIGEIGWVWSIVRTMCVTCVITASDWLPVAAQLSARNDALESPECSCSCSVVLVLRRLSVGGCGRCAAPSLEMSRSGGTQN